MVGGNERLQNLAVRQSDSQRCAAWGRYPLVDNGHKVILPIGDVLAHRYYGGLQVVDFIDYVLPVMVDNCRYIIINVGDKVNAGASRICRACLCIVLLSAKIILCLSHG